DELVVRFSLLEARGISADDYDSEIQTIDRILGSRKDLPVAQRSSGLFVTADILDKQKDFEGAFTYYKRANDVVRREHKFDRQRHTKMIDELIEAFTPDALETLRDAGNDTQLPVLVVGMPRSGTTLVEQILASHSQVFGASEMPQIEKIDYDLRTGSAHTEIKFPQHITAMNTEALSRIAATHISFLRDNVSADAQRIIDKLPTNFMRLGLFALLFPKAKIIHCERDPMASCWSCFSKNFEARAQLSFTLDLSDLGFFHREYERLMKHWRAVLPGSILDVPYEQLIQNPRDISEAMISHIGLDWEESCLKFNEQNTVVQTASSWQVRQPIYKSANEKWRRYEEYLTPLKQALDGKFD
ncbi:MAG: sulfotransferase, partial [Fimbriimonadaceae bacterium]|nr:sulfotransferase [Alphaproteobacteria bacterium]